MNISLSGPLLFFSLYGRKVHRFCLSSRKKHYLCRANSEEATYIYEETIYLIRMLGYVGSVVGKAGEP